MVPFLFVATFPTRERRERYRPSFCAAKRDIQWDRSRSEQTGQRPVESLLLRQKTLRFFPQCLFFLFATSHPGETRTLPSIFLRSKKGHKMGSFAQRTDRAAPCRVSPSAPKDTEVFSSVSFLFVCNFPPGRDENATVHLFAQHFPAFQIKAKNPGTGVPGK